MIFGGGVAAIQKKRDILRDFTVVTAAILFLVGFIVPYLLLPLQQAYSKHYTW